MTEPHRAILNRHRDLLLSYILPNEQLVDSLEDEKVLPASMVADIRLGKTPIEKNDRMLTSLKLRPMSAFRKFRQILSKQGQGFIVEILWDDDENESPFIEESDFDKFPAFKNSLDPFQQKQLITALDSRIKSRLLKSEWRNNSEERLKLLRTKMEEEENETYEDTSKTVANLRSELATKNEALRTVVRDYNELNDDVTHFIQRHQLSVKRLQEKHNLGHGDGSTRAMEMVDPAAGSLNSRFKFVDTAVGDADGIVSSLMEDEVSNYGGKTFVSLTDLKDKIHRLGKMIHDLRSTINDHENEKIQVGTLLDADVPGDLESPLLTIVKRFLFQQQNKRVSLLNEIDQLSVTLRGMNDPDKMDRNSALNGLRQSAVTGNPSPEVVDYCFLKSHVALLQADADHLHKRLSWKDEEIGALHGKLRESNSSSTTSVGRVSRGSVPPSPGRLKYRQNKTRKSRGM